MTAPMLFSTFKITGQVFYQSALSLGLVNLKPLTPGRQSRALPRSCKWPCAPAQGRDERGVSRELACVWEADHGRYSALIRLQTCWLFRGE